MASYFFKTSKRECLSARHNVTVLCNRLDVPSPWHILWVKSKSQVPPTFKEKRLYRGMNTRTQIHEDHLRICHTYHNFNLLLFHILAKAKHSQYISYRILQYFLIRCLQLNLLSCVFLLYHVINSEHFPYCV